MTSADRMGPITAGQLAKAARRYAADKKRFETARNGLRAEVRTAAESGVTEVDLARLAGVDRMTIRAWLGKR